MNKMLECEKERFDKQLRGLKLLPHKYMTLGILIAIIAFLGMLTLKIMSDYDTLKMVFKNVMLLSLLVISVSEDKEEDEMTFKLRGQAFVMAFIWGVLYSFFQPAANWLVGLIITDHTGWVSLSVYQVLLFMLLVQIAFYNFSKRMR